MVFDIDETPYEFIGANIEAHAPGFEANFLPASASASPVGLPSVGIGEMRSHCARLRGPLWKLFLKRGKACFSLFLKTIIFLCVLFSIVFVIAFCICLCLFVCFCYGNVCYFELFRVKCALVCVQLALISHRIRH